MAFLKKDKFDKIDKNRNTVHKPAAATYTVFEKSGKTLFQIDTYGTSGRIMPEKVSQSLQMDKEMAIFLVELLRKEFELK